MDGISENGNETVRQWCFALGGLQTSSDSIEISKAIRLQRLSSLPTQTELTEKLNSPFIAGIAGNHGLDTGSVTSKISSEFAHQQISNFTAPLEVSFRRSKFPHHIER